MPPRRLRQTLPIQFLPSRKTKLLSANLNQTKQVLIPLSNRGTQAIQQQLQRFNIRISNPTSQRLNKYADKSFILSPQQPSRLEQICDKIDKKYSVILPSGNFMFIWYFQSYKLKFRNILLMIGIVYNLFETPISLFMTKQVYIDQFNDPPIIALNYLFLLIFFVDLIVIRPNLAFLSQGQLKTRRYQIVKRHLHLRFILDSLTFIILLIYVSGVLYYFIYVKLLFYIKIYSIVQADREIIDYLQLNKVTYALYQLLRICFFMTFLFLWTACVYFAIDYNFYLQKNGYYQNHMLWLNGSPELDNMDMIQKLSWNQWLAYALYLVLQSSATIGYGNATPRNPESVLYVNVVILSMTVFFAFFINTVWGIISEAESSGVKYYENWENLKRVFIQSQVSQTLKTQVSDYFHEMWKADEFSQGNAAIDQSLSQNLKNQIISLSNLYIFDSIPLFQRMRETYPQRWKLFKIEIIKEIQNLRVAENQIIVSRGDRNSYLCCVMKGQVIISLKDSYFQRSQIIYRRHEQFGHQQFFYNRPAMYEAKSECYSQVARIKSSSMVKVLRLFPELYMNYIRQIHNIQIQKQMDLFNQKCAFCDEYVNEDSKKMDQENEKMKPSSSYSSYSSSYKRRNNRNTNTHISHRCPDNSEWRQIMKVDKSILDSYSKYNDRILKKQNENCQDMESKKIYRSLIKSKKILRLSYFEPIDLDQIHHGQEVKNINLSRIYDRDRRFY